MALKKIAIQVFSDIHLELWNKMPEIMPKSKYLFLAGDICQLNNPIFYTFMDYCSTNWEKVFYTPGNHEYYSKKRNFNELEFEYNYKIGEKYKNIYYLNNKSVSLNEDINVYGTTFWTAPSFKSTYDAKQYLNDYHQISYFNKDVNHVVDFDIKYVKFLAEESHNSLNKYLNENNKKTIVMTHFPPLRTGTSAPKYMELNRTHDLYFSWPNGTLDNLKLDNVMAWISGHTHWSYNFESNNIRLISNQLGYKNELGTTGIDEDGLYEITIS
jgi:predicted phosphohydrolase